MKKIIDIVNKINNKTVTNIAKPSFKNLKNNS